MKNKEPLKLEEIKHLAQLAKLDLTEAELQKLQKQLTETLSYVDNLDELDTTQIEPTYQAGEAENIFFEDGYKNNRGLKVNQVLPLNSNPKAAYFLIKKIL